MHLCPCPSAASYMWGYMVPRIGRAGCMAIATCVHVAFYVMMLIVNSHDMITDFRYESAAS